MVVAVPRGEGDKLKTQVVRSERPQGTSQDSNISAQVFQLNFLEPSSTTLRSRVMARATASSSRSAMMPMKAMIVSSDPVAFKASNAPSPAAGKVDMMVSG